MSNSVSARKVAEATLDGLKDGARKYSKICKDGSPRNAPEYWLTSHIAIKISKLRPKPYIDLEYSTVKTQQEAHSGRGKVSHRLDGEKRFDLVIRYGNENPHAVIEVKSHGNPPSKAIARDIKRLCSILRRKTAKSINFCIFAYFNHRAEHDKDNKKPKLVIRSRFETTKELAAKIAKKKHITVAPPVADCIHGDSKTAWGCLVLVLRRSTRPQREAS